MTTTENAQGLENTFQRAWALLIANPIIVVPGFITAAILLAVLVLALFLGAAAVLVGASGSTTGGVVIGSIAALVVFALIAAVTIVQTGWVTGMAGSAWTTGKASLGEGWAVVGRRAGEIFLAMLILLGIGIVAVLLALPTLTLSLWAYIVFFIYTMPAVIIGGLPAGRAVGEACRIATRNFWPTVGVAAIVMVVSFIAGGLGSELSRSQVFMGSTFSMVLEQVALAYTTLVIVGEYLKMHPADPAPATPVPTPPSTSSG